MPSHVWLCDPMDCSKPGLPVRQQFPEFTHFVSIESVVTCNPRILCRSFLLSPSIFPSIRVFLNKSVFCIRWPKYWSSSFSINPSYENSWLISIRMDRLDLLAVQDSQESSPAPQFKTSILKKKKKKKKHQFFSTQLSL